MSDMIPFEVGLLALVIVWLLAAVWLASSFRDGGEE